MRRRMMMAGGEHLYAIGVESGAFYYETGLYATPDLEVEITYLVTYDLNDRTVIGAVALFGGRQSLNRQPWYICIYRTAVNGALTSRIATGAETGGGFDGSGIVRMLLPNSVHVVKLKSGTYTIDDAEYKSSGTMTSNFSIPLNLCGVINFWDASGPGFYLIGAKARRNGVVVKNWVVKDNGVLFEEIEGVECPNAYGSETKTYDISNLVNK